MKLIKVDATTSTNELSKTLNASGRKGDFCVSTEFQTGGRGQQNSSWQSNRSENLMFTVVYNSINLNIEKRFCLNAIVCLAIYSVLNQVNIKELKLKWPNDILAEGYKICGILIENSLVGTKIKHSYIGIGLNINQTNFENLPKASSLKKLTGKDFDKDVILDKILNELEDLPGKLISNSPQNIINVYKRYLYGYNDKHVFELTNSKIKRGKIKDVGLDGKLIVEFESGELKAFNYKAIKQFY